MTLLLLAGVGTVALVVMGGAVWALLRAAADAERRAEYLRGEPLDHDDR